MEETALCWRSSSSFGLGKMQITKENEVMRKSQQKYSLTSSDSRVPPTPELCTSDFVASS